MSAVNLYVNGNDVQLDIDGVRVFSQGPGPTPTGPTAPPGPTAPTAPPPPQGDGLDAARARQRVSQNCLWVLTTSAESGPLLAKLGNSYHQYVQFYTVGGTGSFAPPEFVDVNSPTGYSFVKIDQSSVNDVNQAADAYVELRAEQEQKPGAPPPANLG